MHYIRVMLINIHVQRYGIIQAVYTGARFTKRFKTYFILSLNLGLISVKICLILKMS